MSKFKRETRYFAIKISHLTKKQLSDLEAMHLPTVDAVVVESDWPNYEQTWDDVEAVCKGEFIPNKIKIAELNKGAGEFQEGFFSYMAHCDHLQIEVDNLKKKIANLTTPDESKKSGGNV